MSEFVLEESNAGDGRGSDDPLAASLRSAWTLPNDTFITDGFPLLLTRLGLIPYRSGGEESGEATAVEPGSTARPPIS